MSHSTELAQAARRVAALAERLPERHRPDIAAAWAELTDDIDDMSDKQAITRIDAWLADMEDRLTGPPLNAPLEGRL